MAQKLVLAKELLVAVAPLGLRRLETLEAVAQYFVVGIGLGRPSVLRRIDQRVAVRNVSNYPFLEEMILTARAS